MKKTKKTVVKDRLCYTVHFKIVFNSDWFKKMVFANVDFLSEKMT